MNESILKALQTINSCLDNNSFVAVEMHNIELKDLSTGSEWTSLKESVCSFLNTDGGTIICGIRERNNKYVLTSFDRNNESRLAQDLSKKTFQDDRNQTIDVSDYLLLEYISFRDGEIAVISIKPLSEDLKFVKYNSKFFERKLTGDYEISGARINQQKEYKSELEYSKEQSIVKEASSNDLSLDKINNFINLLNKSSKKETLKPDLTIARQFLERRHFIKGEEITTLGMLVCGLEPFRFLEYRTEIDCYFDTSSSISKDKKEFQDDVLTLMEEAFRFVWGHIRTGKTYEDGGKTVAEYPEELVREVINNSLAHRDYSINKFVTIRVEPNKFLEIKNPGRFKEKIKITDNDDEIPVRRLIPGIPESKNPKLASVLKVFDKIESQGRGMAALVNYTLDNKIDLPYYELIDDDSISLVIPSGKLLDNESESWISSFENYIVSKLKDKIKTEHKVILSYFRKSEFQNKRRRYTILLTESNNHFLILEQLKNAGLIFEHKASNSNTPIFVLDRELMKTDFTQELIKIIGEGFVNFNSISKHILNTIYRHTFFNKQAVKPVQINPEIYELLHGKAIDPIEYEKMSRVVRKVCRNLNERDILNKNNKGAYELNFNHVVQDNLL